MEYTFNQGSIWRRWDLHVHTKGTNKMININQEHLMIFVNYFLKEH